MPWFKTCLLLLTMTGLLGLQAATADVPHVRIPRVKRPPTLADFLEGRPREAEAVVTGLKQFMPKDGAPVSGETTVYLSYDDDNLYAVFVCKDDPAEIRAHVGKRDHLDTEDRVSICLDTFNDHHRNYWFDTNPYGCQQDGMTIDGVDDYNWDAVYHSDAKLTADGYVVLATIPFRSIRFPGRPVQDWGFAVVRLITRNNEMSCYPFISSRLEGWSTQFGKLEGIENVSQGPNLQLIPYTLFSNSTYLDEPPDAPANFQSHREGRVGLDAKMVLGDAFALDATLRPDFSQVESDQPQVTVNQRYEVIYPEKRPFFLENANLFSTPTNLFFSRRIVDPRVGVRLTGQMDSWALGALVADDMAPAEQAPAGQPGETGPVADHRAGIGVLRLFREFDSGDRVGFLATDRNLGQGFSRLISMDTRNKLVSNWVLETQWMNSETKRVDGTRLAGPACLGRLSFNSLNWNYSLLYEDRSAGFNTDLGYIDRVDIRRGSQYVGYTFHVNQGALLSLKPTLTTSGTWDRKGMRQNWETLPGFEVELTRQTHFRVEHSEAFERYLGLEFNEHRNGFSASSEVFPWLALSGSASRGAGANYYPAPGLVPFLGETRYDTAGLTLRPSPRLSIENSFIYSQLQTSAMSGLPGFASGTNVFTNRILRSKWNYQFTREFSLRCIFDHNELVPDTRLIDPSQFQLDKRFNVDVLFAYFLHPGTAVYLGYSDLCRNIALDPTQPTGLRNTEGIGLSAGRQVYCKVSWLFRP